MNKLIVGTLLAFACISSYADDLNVADDFESGDLVSADTFNQIFDTIEKINRTVVDSDLVGVWKCSSLVWGATNPATSGWTEKGFTYLMEDAQLNLTASSAASSIESPYSFTTSAPTPLYLPESAWSADQIGVSSTGTYVLYNGLILFKGNLPEVYSYQIDLVSNDRFVLRNTKGSNQAGSLICDSAEAVPASPTAPSVSIDADNKRLTIAWTDSSNDETGFKVYRKLSSETEYSLLTTMIGETSYADPDVTENLTAYYQITAYNDNGESAKSKTVSEIGDYTAPTVTSTSPAKATSVPQSDFSGPPAPGTLPVVFSFSESVVLTLANCNPCNPFALTKNGGPASNGSDYGFSPPAEIGQEPLVNSYQVDVGYSAATTFVLTLGQEYIRDTNGNYMVEDFSLTFTTP